MPELSRDSMYFLGIDERAVRKIQAENPDVYGQFFRPSYLMFFLSAKEKSHLPYIPPVETGGLLEDGIRKTLCFTRKTFQVFLCSRSRASACISCLKAGVFNVFLDNMVQRARLPFPEAFAYRRREIPACSRRRAAKFRCAGRRCSRVQADADTGRTRIAFNHLSITIFLYEA